MDLRLTRINEDVVQNAAARCREKGITIPTLAQMKDPRLIPANITDRLKDVGLWDIDPLNLYRITWQNNPETGLFNQGNWIELPSALTGIDARVIALFGRHVRPRPVAEVHEKQEELQQLVTRRRQLVNLRTAEKNRMETLSSKPVRKSVQQVIDLLNKQIKRIEKAIAALLDSDDDWTDKGRIIESVPGVGPVVVSSLLADLPR